MADATITGSRVVRIKRAPSFLSRSQGKEFDDYFGQAVQNIGSYWESSSAKRIASGLKTVEEQLLLPIILGIPASDREFWTKRDDFYASLEVRVPAKDGIEFDISLTDDSKPLGADLGNDIKNLPNNIHHYVRYRFAIGHPWTAPSESEATGNQLKHFYVHDDILATNDVASLNDTKDEALGYFLQIKTKADKVNMMLTLLGTDYRDVVGQTDKQTEQLRVDKLRTILDAKPAEFKKIHEDKDFEVKYTIQMLLNTQIFRRIGTKILESETGDSIGTYDETVQFFKDEAENSDKIAVFKAKLQEATRAGKKAKRTVTK